MILFALALLAASPAEAAPASPATPVVAAAKPNDDMDKVVCHLDPETGTRLGSHKECHTKREWVQLQTDTNNMMDRATTVYTAGGPH